MNRLPREFIDTREQLDFILDDLIQKEATGIFHRVHSRFEQRLDAVQIWTMIITLVLGNALLFALFHDKLLQGGSLLFHPIKKRFWNR